MKRFFKKITMTVAALLSFLPASAQRFEVDGIYYNVTDATNHEVEVSFKTGGTYWGDIIIPPTVTNGVTTYTVTAIGIKAFWACYDLTSITISNSITSIGSSAFESCIRLTSITIPNSVTSIGKWAFGACTGLFEITVDSGNEFYASVDGVLYNKNLTNIIQYPGGKTGAFSVPNSVTAIESGAFGSCLYLTGITIPNSVTSIESYTFWGCAGLTSINIPNSVTSIGDYAFHGCQDLTSITIPNSVTSIGEWAFQYCI